MKKLIWLTCCVIGMLVLSWKMAPEASRRLDGTPEENFQSYCSGCHGEQMQAFVDRKWLHGNTEDALIKSIKKGHPDAGMPAFGGTFSNAEIKALAQYIQSGLSKMKEYSFQETPFSEGRFSSAGMSLRVDTVLDGLDIPWGLAFLPDGDLLISERDGELLRYTPGTKNARKVSGAPNVVARGQGGLLDLALHPNFASNGWLYISYSAPDGGDKATTAVSRYQLKGNALTDGEEIFRASPGVKTRHHYGSRLTFDREGYLFITVGDRGRRDDHPQFLSNHCGKVHRIHDDGEIPSDNPFLEEAGAQKSIFSYGHRNPQGMDLHPETGEIWAHEHGPRGGDELNRIQKGLNYGWPTISYGINYSGTTFTELTAQKDMQQPELYWVPSIGPSGMSFVSGDRYPGWDGDILAGSMRFKYLNRIDMDGEIVVGEELLLKNIGRVRNVRQGPDGYIYVAIEKPGVILRIMPE